MTNTSDQPHNELQETLAGVRRRLRALTTAILILTLAVILCVIAVFGSLINYFGKDEMLQGGIAVVSAALGFGLGWFARRRA